MLAEMWVHLVFRRVNRQPGPRWRSRGYSATSLAKRCRNEKGAGCCRRRIAVLKRRSPQRRVQVWLLQSTAMTQPFIFSELPETEPEPA